MNFLVPACRRRRPELPERPAVAEPDGPGTPGPAGESPFLPDAVRMVPA
ncbi:hypothetical protein ACIRU5_10600 [Streptomyces misionensis]